MRGFSQNLQFDPPLTSPPSLLLGIALSDQVQRIHAKSPFWLKTVRHIRLPNQLLILLTLTNEKNDITVSNIKPWNDELWLDIAKNNSLIDHSKRTTLTHINRSKSHLKHHGSSSLHNNLAQGLPNIIIWYDSEGHVGIIDVYSFPAGNMNHRSEY